MGAGNSYRIGCRGIEVWRCAETAMAMAEVAELGTRNEQEGRALHLQQQLPIDWEPHQAGA